MVSGPFLKGDSLPPSLAPSRNCPKMRSNRCTTPHVAKHSVVDPFTNACPFKCIFASFLADSSASLRAVPTMKARGDDDDDEDSNNSNDKVWDKDEDEDDEQ